MDFNSTIKKIKLEDLSSLSKKEGEQLLFEAGYHKSYKEKTWFFDMDLEDDPEWDYIIKTFYFLKNESGNIVDKKMFSEYIEEYFENISYLIDFAWEEV